MLNLTGRPVGEVLDYKESALIESQLNRLLIAVYYDRNLNVLHTSKVFTESR
jgi:hypothetical protein